jgi:hypothetical protein
MLVPQSGLFLVSGAERLDPYRTLPCQNDIVFGVADIISITGEM